MRREKAMKDISELSNMMHMKRKMEKERGSKVLYRMKKKNKDKIERRLI